MAAGSKASLQEKRLLPGASLLFWATLLLYTVRDSLKASSTESWAIPFLKFFSCIYLKSHCCGPEVSQAGILPFCSIPQKNEPVLAAPPCQAPSLEHQSKPVATSNFCPSLRKTQPNLLNSTAKPKTCISAGLCRAPCRICSPGWKAHPSKALGLSHSPGRSGLMPQLCPPQAHHRFEASQVQDSSC